MAPNRSVKEFVFAKTYQFIFFVLALHVCAVKSLATFVNDPEQRKLCRVKTKQSDCAQDEKCAWQDWQGLCNEKGHQPDIQQCPEPSCPGPNRIRIIFFTVQCIS